MTNTLGTESVVVCLRAILGTLCVYFALCVRKLNIFFQLMKYAHEIFLLLFLIDFEKSRILVILCMS